MVKLNRSSTCGGCCTGFFSGPPSTWRLLVDINLCSHSSGQASTRCGLICNPVTVMANEGTGLYRCGQSVRPRMTCSIVPQRASREEVRNLLILQLKFHLLEIRAST